ncbi:hypothetical protein FOZ61_002156, partial [Perkinsus olseni]
MMQTGLLPPAIIEFGVTVAVIDRRTLGKIVTQTLGLCSAIRSSNFRTHDGLESPISVVHPSSTSLNPSAYIDFDKYFNSSSSTFEASSLAEDLDGNPVLVRKLLPSTMDEEKSRAKPIKNFSAKWSRAFIIYSVAVLVVQEAESSSTKTPDQQGESAASDSSSDSDDAGYISFLDMLALHKRILWYAAEYNWSMAACVDKSVRQAIDATCRSGTRSLAQCYKSFDLWSGKASEAVGLAMNSQTAPCSTLRQPQ